jgi:hypothetical protein
MTLLERTGWAALVVGAAALGVVACSSTESLGSGDDDGGADATNGTGGRDGDGGESSTGGANVAGASAGGRAGGGSGGTAGKSGSGGTAGKSGSGGTAGKAGSGGTAGKAGSGGTAGKAGSGGTAGAGGGEDCSTVSCAPLPPKCPAGTLVARPLDNCCVQCVPKEQLPPAACVINGDLYENGEVIPFSACSSCVCVDGVIGRCTGACPPGVTDAGPDRHPECSASQRLIATCDACNYEHCEKYEYECRELNGCDAADAGFQCGAEHSCFQGACVDLAGLCVI